MKTTAHWLPLALWENFITSIPILSKGPLTEIGVSVGLIGFPTCQEEHFSQALHNCVTSLCIPGHQYALPICPEILASHKWPASLPLWSSLIILSLSSFEGIIRCQVVRYQECSKLFTNCQAKLNSEHYVIKCVGGRYIWHCSYGFIPIVVCHCKSNKPKYHTSTLSITYLCI